MTYQAPVDDYSFVLKELTHLKEILMSGNHDELDFETVDVVLEESARFVQTAVAPLNRPGDLQPARVDHGVVKVADGFAQAFQDFGNGGWQGLHHDPKWGGQGLPRVVGAACTEMLHGANMAFALCPMLTDGVIEALSVAGSPEQCQRFIPALLQGRWTGTMNLTEPQAGSDLAQIRTRAMPQSDGTYRLFGQKIYITYGEHDMAGNIVHLVLARTPDAPEGIKGISLFIVPKFLVNEDGSLGSRNDVWCASLEHKLGIHASPTAVMLYGDNKGNVGEGAIGYLVGEKNRGLEYMFIMMNAARYAVGLQGIAISELATQDAVNYAAQRVQSRDVEGSTSAVTIDHHPDVQRMLMTMRALTEGNRASALYAAGLADMARVCPDTAERERYHAQYEYMIPVIKGFSTEAAVEIASLGVQVHGGMGYIEETGVAQYYRDARILPIYEGTTAIQANDFIGRKIIRDKGTVAFELIRQMSQTVEALRAQATTLDNDEQAPFQWMANRLERGVEAYKNSVQHMLASTKSGIRDRYLGSVPLLMLAGIVHAGWHLARAALVCSQPGRPGGDTPFHRQKVTTALFYMTCLMPRANAYAEAIAGIAAVNLGDYLKV